MLITTFRWRSPTFTIIAFESFFDFRTWSLDALGFDATTFISRNHGLVAAWTVGSFWWYTILWLASLKGINILAFLP